MGRCIRYIKTCFIRWRLWIRPFIMFLYTVIIFAGLPFLIVKMTTQGVTGTIQAWLVGTVFVVLCLPLSLWDITQHLIHYTNPMRQKHIIRILWMVPIYSLNAWLSMTVPKFAIYFDTLRECYEAYVIYNFMIFLLNFLQEVQGDVYGALEQKKQPLSLPFSSVQVAIPSQKFQLENQLEPATYTTLIPSINQLVEPAGFKLVSAVYWNMVPAGMKMELEGSSSCQGVVIAILVATHVIPKNIGNAADGTKVNISIGIQMWDVSDVTQDVNEHITVIRKTVTRGVGGSRLFGTSASGSNLPRQDEERTRLLTPCVDEIPTSSNARLRSRYQSMSDSEAEQTSASSDSIHQSKTVKGPVEDFEDLTKDFTGA
ncbi:unnamed protein product [Darwinula stevensoni]|uniref:Transmembrane protein 184C n=1 Tax=Darwinula stevensoni TaxID=69355 RepID=A0A7R8X8I1_9CRUS|nr:unnamed protein product [Darwinula stevensoni]CAG0881581.1 unnamed protein product [Darwinula stevensoni]